MNQHETEKMSEVQQSEDLGSAGHSLLIRCLLDKCQRLAIPQPYARGLCLQCYSEAKKLVEGGKTTWDGLVRIGLARDTIASPFVKEFKRRMSQDN